MFRGIAATSLIVSASLVLACSGVALREQWLPALGGDASGPRQAPQIDPEETAAGAALEGETAGQSTAEGLAAGPPQSTSPRVEEGHWVFVRSSDEYEARLRTADALAATLAEKLSDTERSAAAQIDAMQRELSGERARSTGPGQAAAQARAGDAGRAGGGSVGPAPGASEDLGAQREAPLAAPGGSAAPQGAAAARTDALQRRIDEEQARATGLDHALRDARDQLAQDRTQRAAADARAASLADALASTKLQLADLQRDAAKAQELSGALVDQRSRSADLARDLSDARAGAAQAAQRSMADDARAIAAESAAAAAAGAAARLQSAQDALRAKLADLERAAAERDASAREAADGRVRLAALERDDAGMREIVAQAADRARAADAQAASLRESSDKLVATEQASKMRLEEMQAHLGEERARGDALEKELAAERTRAAASERVSASAEAGRRSSEADAEKARVSADGALQASRDAAAAERRATAQVDALRAQAASAEARATALGRDAAGLRDRDVADERAKEEAERRLETALADAKAAVEQRDAARGESEREGARAAALDAQLATARTDLARAEARRAEAVAIGRRSDEAIRDLKGELSQASATILTLRERVEDGARPRQTPARQPDAGGSAPAPRPTREADLGRERSRPRPAAVDGTAAADDGAAADARAPTGVSAVGPAPTALGGAMQPGAGSAVSTGRSAAVVSADPPGLPKAVEARVSLQYARDEQAALDRAAAFREALRARGIDVAAAAPSAASIGGDRVLFFYAEDQRSAEMVAGGLLSVKPTQGRAEEGTTPRPGTIEVTLAGRASPSVKGRHPLPRTVFGEARR